MPSAIEWTDETWNPVTGCSRVSPGCDNCYMYAIYPRLHGMRTPGYSANPDVLTLMPERAELPLRWKKPRRVFVNSMSDLFHYDVPDQYILRLFQVMHQAAITRGHIFQILTKRPGRVVGWWKEHCQYFVDGWPPNIWIGTSVESQKYAPRITVLERVPAPVRFVSAEPLLEEVDLLPWLKNGLINWVIVGGESGPNHRPLKSEWVLKIKNICLQQDVAFFFKQWGGRTPKSNGRLLDGRTWDESPMVGIVQAHS